MSPLQRLFMLFLFTVFSYVAYIMILSLVSDWSTLGLVETLKRIAYPSVLIPLALLVLRFATFPGIELWGDTVVLRFWAHLFEHSPPKGFRWFPIYTPRVSDIKLIIKGEPSFIDQVCREQGYGGLTGKWSHYHQVKKSGNLLERLEYQGYVCLIMDNQYVYMVPTRFFSPGKLKYLLELLGEAGIRVMYDEPETYGQRLKALVRRR